MVCVAAFDNIENLVGTAAAAAVLCSIVECRKAEVVTMRVVCITFVMNKLRSKQSFVILSSTCFQMPVSWLGMPVSKVCSDTV